jgi:hypothetical protein
MAITLTIGCPSNGDHVNSDSFTVTGTLSAGFQIKSANANPQIVVMLYYPSPAPGSQQIFQQTTAPASNWSVTFTNVPTAGQAYIGAQYLDTNGNAVAFAFAVSVVVVNDGSGRSCP